MQPSISNTTQHNQGEFTLRSWFKKLGVQKYSLTDLLHFYYFYHFSSGTWNCDNCHQHSIELLGNLVTLLSRDLHVQIPMVDVTCVELEIRAHQRLYMPWCIIISCAQWCQMGKQATIWRHIHGNTGSICLSIFSIANYEVTTFASLFFLFFLYIC